MKRREFLVASAGLAGTLIPVIARSQHVPCPPGSVHAEGGSSVQTQCGTPSGAAPSWFVQQPERTWKAVATSATLLNAYATPTSQLPLNGASFDITKAYTGACVDQSRGEYLMAANGGHDNYRGNEVYACQIRSENPAWYRLLDRSPTSVVDPPVTTGSASASSANDLNSQGHNPSGYAAMYRDGRMRAQHGWHSNIFANGKVWYPHQASPAGIGYSSPHAWSFNRNYPGLATAPGQTPLAHPNLAPGVSTPGPWEWLGPSDGTPRSSSARGGNFGTAPVAAYDPVSGKIWCAGESVERTRWMSLDTSSSMITGYSGGGGATRACWATVVYDPSGDDLWRYFVVNSRDYPSSLFILDLKQGTPSWSQVAVSNSVVNRSGLGAVYHKASRSILLYDASDMLNGELYKIRVPTSGNPYAGGTWQVSTLNPAVGSANPHTGVPTGGGAAGGQYTWSKFNIIEDMGNGQSALVVCMGTDLPVYVYKLPLQGV